MEGAWPELLERQAGVVSQAQAGDHGFTRSALAARVQSGRWRRIHPRVYATFDGPLPRAAQMWAALLHAGPNAALCRSSAAEVDGLLPSTAPAMICLSVPADRRVADRPGIRVHRSRRHAAAAHPCASPPRTRIEETVLDLVDAAPTADAALAVIAGACQRRLTTAGRLAALCVVRGNLRWRAVVLPVLRDVDSGAHSLLELRYLRDVERRHGLPTGRRQRAAQRGRGQVWIDVDYAVYTTIVELDGRLGHEGTGAWRDMRRDNAAVVAGEAPLRYGWSDVTARPCEVAREVAGVLGSRGWAGAPRRCGNRCTL